MNYYRHTNYNLAKSYDCTSSGEELHPHGAYIYRYDWMHEQ